jgi:hypothetical protein
MQNKFLADSVYNNNCYYNSNTKSLKIYSAKRIEKLENSAKNIFINSVRYLFS